MVDVTNNNTAVGSCGKSGLVATCTLFSGTSIAPGDQVSIEFDGVINPSSAGSQTVSVSTSSDTPAVTSATYNIVAGHQITQPQVTISSPSAAAGARTVYFVTFATSSTGGLSRQGVSNITVTFPTGTDITSALGNTSVVDVTNNNTAVGSCGKSGLVATCTLFSGTSIAPGDQVSIEFDGVINPSSAGSQTVSVSTSSDTPAVTSATYNIVAGHQITQPQVTISSPSAAAGARTVYFVTFATSSTGGLSRQGVSNITVTFPTGTDITSALGNTSVVDVTNNNTAVGSCGKSGLVATCTLFSGTSIAPGDQVSIEFDGVINPSSAGSQTVSVSTSSDTPAVTSATYNIVAGHQITQPQVTISSPSAAAGARTVYFVTFATSSTGGLSRQGVSNITVTFPTGTDITSALGNTSVVDVTNNNTAIGSCGKSGLVATCTLFSGTSIAAATRSASNSTASSTRTPPDRRRSRSAPARIHPK